MRKINLRPYKVASKVMSPITMRVLRTPGVIDALRGSREWTDEQIENLVARKPVEQEYRVKESLAQIILSPQLRLTGQQVYDRRHFYAKIIAAGNELLLDDSEYKILRDAVAQFKGGGPNEMELTARVFEAEQVEGKSKKKDKKS